MAESGTLDYLPVESIVLHFFCATRYELPGKALPLSTFSVAFNSTSCEKAHRKSICFLLVFNVPLIAPRWEGVRHEESQAKVNCWNHFSSADSRAEDLCHQTRRDNCRQQNTSFRPIRTTLTIVRCCKPCLISWSAFRLLSHPISVSKKKTIRW